MIYYDDVAKESIKKLNLNQLQIPDHPYRISLIGSENLKKRNVLLNMTKQQNDDYYSIVDKMYL